MRCVIASLLILGMPLAIAGCDKQSQGSGQESGKTISPVDPAPRDGAPGPSFSSKIDESHRGEEMPDATFRAPDGSATTLAQHKGKPVLVNLWATWCGPCKEEMPMLDTLAGRETARLEVLTISEDMEGEKTVAPYFERQNFHNLNAYLDPENRLALGYGAANLPTSVFYDAEGKEVWRVVGGFDWESERARQMMEPTLSAYEKALLAKPPLPEVKPLPQPPEEKEKSKGA